MALDFIAGCAGGIVGVVVGHPLDTVKVRLQTQDHLKPVYKGTWHTFFKIIKEEGVRGLFKGVTSPMGGVAFVNAIVFGVYGNFMRYAGDKDRLMSHFNAGVVTGLTQSFICSPMELAKSRLQVQKTMVYKSAIHCLVTMFKTGGVRELYKGLCVTMVREVPAFSSYFLTYEAMIRGRQGTVAELLVAGGTAGCVSWLVAYPIDVIKTRYQSDDIPGEPKKYRGAFHCYRVTVAQEGYQALFKGLNTTMIRAFPVNGVTFATVTWVFKIYEKLEEKYLKPHSDESLSKKKNKVTPTSLHVSDTEGVHSQEWSRTLSTSELNNEDTKVTEKTTK